MMRSVFEFAVFASAFLCGCFFPPECPDRGEPPSLEGSFIEQNWESVIPDDAATLEVGQEDAVLEYSSADGSRWRARYVIVSRATDP